MKTRVCLTFATALSILSLSNLQAQSITATLNGVVTDATGAAIPDTHIILTGYAESRRYTLVSNGHGEFAFPLLSPGNYKLLASHAGFGPVQVLFITLQVSDVKTLSVRMHPGRVDQQVTVSGLEDIVVTNPTVQTTIDKNFVEELPLNGRSFQSLILLSPGVVAAPLTSGGIGQFSVNGQRTDANYYTVDGASANNGLNPNSIGGTLSKYLAGNLPTLNSLGTTSSLVSVDALDQFTLQTSSFTAETGRQSGGQIQLATRAGNNGYHGDAFDFLRNEFFDARNYFSRICVATTGCKASPKTKSRQNDFGGSFGGPVRIPGLYNGTDRTFFFASYEGLRLFLPTTETQEDVPSATFRAQAVAAKATTASILNAFPLPNGGPDPAGNGDWDFYSNSYTTPYNTNATSIRVDQNVTDRLHVYARYSYAPSINLSRNLSVVQTNIQNSTTGTVNAVLTITPKLANEFLINYSRNTAISSAYQDAFGGATPLSAQALTSGYTGSGSHNASINLYYDNISASYTLGDSNTSLQRQLQVADNLNWTLGTHTLRFGGDVRRLAPIYQPIGFSASYSFANNPVSPTDNDSILNNQLDSYTIESKQEEHLHFPYYSVFAQDAWKATKRLTFNYGVRWDINPAPTEESGQRAASVVLPNPNDLSTARLSTASDPAYGTSYGGVAPRFGGAYLVHATSGAETVVRGGIGLYFDPNSSQAAAGFSTYPFDNYYSSYSDPYSTPNSNVISYPLTAAQTPPPTISPLTLPTFYNLRALQPNLQLPFNMQWNVTLQQTFNKQSLSIAYVGSTAQRLLTTQVLNGANPLTFKAPNLNFGQITYTYNQPTSNYHSLQVQYIRPLYQRIQLLANYTWSHAIDDVSNDFATGVLDRSNADFDTRNNATAALLYNLPTVKKGAGFANLLARGISNNWHVSGIAIGHSGNPVNITAGTYTASNGRFTSARPDRNYLQPLFVAAPGQPGGKKINYRAFTDAPHVAKSVFSQYSRQGTTPRNAVTLPALYQINAAVERQVPFSERVNLVLRGEVYNIVNHPNFGYYSTFWSTFATPTSNFGSPVTANSALNGTNPLYNLGGPRSMQLSAKIRF